MGWLDRFAGTPGKSLYFLLHRRHHPFCIANIAIFFKFPAAMLWADISYFSCDFHNHTLFFNG